MWVFLSYKKIKILFLTTLVTAAFHNYISLFSRLCEELRTVGHSNLLVWFSKNLNMYWSSYFIKNEILDRLVINLYGDLKIKQNFKMEISISIYDCHSPWTLCKNIAICVIYTNVISDPSIMSIVLPTDECRIESHSTKIHNSVFSLFIYFFFFLNKKTFVKLFLYFF